MLHSNNSKMSKGWNTTPPFIHVHTYIYIRWTWRCAFVYSFHLNEELKAAPWFYNNSLGWNHVPGDMLCFQPPDCDVINVDEGGGGSGIEEYSLGGYSILF